MSRSAGIRTLGDSRSARQAACRRRRRILLATLFLGLLAAAVAVNWGPLTDYLDARARLEKATREVAALEQQRLGLQAELGKLTEASYLENLARKELSYARPGEELYIVVDSSASSESEAAPPANPEVQEASPGLFERLVLALIDFFGGSTRE